MIALAFAGLLVVPLTPVLGGLAATGAVVAMLIVAF